jgi:predicted RNase H-like HicB family nuclease
LAKHFVVSDGEIVLFLGPAVEGGYTITSPLDDRLVSQAESLEEALEMGHDALNLLHEHDRGIGQEE